MDKQELKLRVKILSEQIKSLKEEIKSSAKSGSYFVINYSNGENDIEKYLLKHGYGLLGVSSNSKSKLVTQKIEVRALNIAIAYLTNKKFKDVEKYYYNNGIEFQYSLLVKDVNRYSTYVERRYRQLSALDQARILLGSFKIETKVSTSSKKSIEVKKALPHNEFDRWLETTGNLY